MQILCALASCTQARLDSILIFEMGSVEELEQRITNHKPTYNSEGPHHEFKDGGHGYKVDMEQIPQGSVLFNDLIDIASEKITENNSRIPEVIISIANGGHPWAQSLGKMLGSDTTVIETTKNSDNVPLLSLEARKLLRVIQPYRLVYVDDLGTTGASILPAYNQVNFSSRLQQPIRHQSVFYIATRQERLRRLRREKISYSSAVCLNLRTFRDKSECETDLEGLCGQNIPLIKRA
jgi:hypoxanthine phosphoribosyltransferase